MDQVHVVRHKVLVEGVSVRRVAKEMGISRNTVRRYLDEKTRVGERAPVERRRPVLDRVRGRLDELLDEAPRWTGGKQRLTATRLHRMLRDEGYAVGETLVKTFVREWKRQRREVFVPLTYKPGDLAEVDFFEVLVDVDGERRKAWLFLARLMHSKRDFAWLYGRQDQVCFLDGHVRAFAHWQAVPQRMLYDNLKPAVAKVLVGAERELSGRFEALASHYLFEPCFARPATGHDKGGVEARGKAIRWQHLVPIPSGPDFDAISRVLLSRLDCDAVEERFAEERAHMLPLPKQPFQAAAMRVVTVSRRSLVQLEGAVYSVPSRWAELEVKAYIGADRIEVEGPDGRVEHARKHFGGRSVDYRHYVRELARKPQAVRQVADELIRDLGEPFGSTWRRLVDEHGPKQGARVFAHVLRALEDHGHRHVVERLERALVDDEPVLLALRAGAPPPEAPRSEWLPAHLKQVDVQSGRAADYDALLRGAQ